MSSHQIRMQHHFKASVDTLFDFFADHHQFGRLWPGRTRRIRDGDSERDGCGSVREITIGPVQLEETVTAFERPQRIEYTITRGGPLQSHHGCIRFAAEGTGSRLDYHIDITCRWPLLGALLARKLPRDLARGLQSVREELS